MMLSFIKTVLRWVVDVLSPFDDTADAKERNAEAMADIDMKYHEIIKGERPTHGDFEQYKSQYMD